MWGALWIALPVFVIIIAGFIAGVRLPGNFPVGLAALLLGTAIGWIGGFMEPAAVSDAAKTIAVGLPSLNVDLLFDGLERHLAAAGDRDPARHLQLHRGDEQRGVAPRPRATTTTCATCCSPTAPAPSSAPASAARSRPPSTSGSRAGRRPAAAISYSLATGVLIFALCVFGLFPLLDAMLPIPAIVPVLLYIGLVIGAQAFPAVPKAHYAAIVLAAIPTLAQWAIGLIDNALLAAGTSAARSARTRWRTPAWSTAAC